MNQYTILRRKEPFSWEQIPALPVSNQLWGTETDITAQAQLCYDGEAIYVAMEATERHIRAEECGKLGMPCLDSCLEFFFCPIPGDNRYFNIEYNPNCCLCFGFGGDCRVRLVVKEELLAPQVTRTEAGWRIEYRIPFQLIRQFVPEFTPASGTAIRANCYKCGELTVRNHYLSWNPVELPKPCFHCPPHFGIMYFE